MPQLEIHALNKHYDGVHALKNISFSLDTGKVLGLIGDNGAGKSTLMKCVTGAEKPDAGHIHFNGQDVSGRPHDSRLAGIEMIYQDLNLCPQLDVSSNIFLGQEIKSSSCFLNDRLMREKSREILARLNADIPVDTPVGQLSGGQQQAVAIARALLANPKLLIMDEPTAALGVREAGKVLALIQSLKANGITVIIISHRLADIFEVADRIILMRRGEIREDKPVLQTSIQEITEKILA